ncbi:MAG: pimeloyl-ACP methyl ester carboxylesterase [Candidatus Nanohaloarchaea archaeon]|jgi:pimeloyl-ACP methyl ester carboxylesterase
MEKVSFENNRGLELVGNFWKADSDAGIVMVHGFTGDKSEHGYFDKVADELNEAGYNVLAFDFAGSGESDDEPLRINKQVEDLEVAIDYLKSKKVERIGLFGHSQGGLVALRNYNKGIETMVLTSPVTDRMANYADDRLDERQKSELEEKGQWTVYLDKGPREKIIVDQEIIREKESINQDKLLSRIDCPVLIIHGNEDEVVPIESSKKAVQKLSNSELKAIKGLDHSYDRFLDQISESTVKWFEKHLPISET